MEYHNLTPSVQVRLYALDDVRYLHRLKQSTAVVVVADGLIVSLRQYFVSSHGFLYSLIESLRMVGRYRREVS